MAELVVAVLSAPPIAPERRVGSRNTGPGSSGAAARRSITTKPAPSATAATSRIAPANRRPGCAQSVVPTMTAMTAAVKAADPETFSDPFERSAPTGRSGGTERATATASRAASGR